MEPEVFSVYLVNFGNMVWQGPDFAAAHDAAKRTGFECAIYSNITDQSWTWSPIGGLRRSFSYTENVMT